MRRGSSSSHSPAAAKEKQRRDRMKDLYSTLGTLLHLKPYESKSLPAFLDQATTSLTHLKESIQRLKVKKEELENEVNHNGESSNGKTRLKMVQVTESEQKLVLNMIFMANNEKWVLSKVLRIIEQGGAEIAYYNLCTIGHNTYCTIHAQAFLARLGFDAKLIESQLKELVY